MRGRAVIQTAAGMPDLLNGSSRFARWARIDPKLKLTAPGLAPGSGHSKFSKRLVQRIGPAGFGALCIGGMCAPPACLWSPFCTMLLAAETRRRLYLDESESPNNRRQVARLVTQAFGRGRGLFDER